MKRLSPGPWSHSPGADSPFSYCRVHMRFLLFTISARRNLKHKFSSPIYYLPAPRPRCGDCSERVRVKVGHNRGPPRMATGWKRKSYVIPNWLPVTGHRSPPMASMVISAITDYMPQQCQPPPRAVSAIRNKVQGRPAAEPGTGPLGNNAFIYCISRRGGGTRMRVSVEINYLTLTRI